MQYVQTNNTPPQIKKKPKKPAINNTKNVAAKNLTQQQTNKQPNIHHRIKAYDKRSQEHCYDSRRWTRIIIVL